jgi:hypothetical protein
MDRFELRVAGRDGTLLGSSKCLSAAGGELHGDSFRSGGLQV